MNYQLFIISYSLSITNRLFNYWWLNNALPGAHPGSFPGSNKSSGSFRSSCWNPEGIPDGLPVSLSEKPKSLQAYDWGYWHVSVWIIREVERVARGIIPVELWRSWPFPFLKLPEQVNLPLNPFRPKIGISPTSSNLFHRIQTRAP